MTCLGARMLVSALAACIVVSSQPALVLADVETDKAMAEQFFQQGRALLVAGKTGEACTKFAASAQIEAKPGTLLNLAECYEATTRFASAWARYKELLAVASRLGQTARAEHAKQKADGLEQKLTFLKINADESTPQMEVRRNGERLRPEALGALIPLDSGDYMVEATAPGRVPFRRTIRLAGRLTELTIPPLAIDPAKSSANSSANSAANSAANPSANPSANSAANPSANPSANSAANSAANPSANKVQDAAGTHTSSPLRPMAIGAWAFGGGSAIASVVLGLVAKGNNESALAEQCPERRCTPEGADRIRDAHTLGNVGTGFAITAGVLVLAGVVLFLVASSGKSANIGTSTREPYLWRF
jgi:hypothetical protein